MMVMGYLTEAEYQDEIARPLNVISKPTVGPAKFPDFLDIVRRQLRTEYQESDITNQGLRIFTTLDPIAQTKVQTVFKNSVERLAQRNPARLKDLQGAILVAHPENGELIAAVGSTQDFTGFNRTIDAKRQVGSLLKPVIFLMRLNLAAIHGQAQLKTRLSIFQLMVVKAGHPKIIVAMKMVSCRCNKRWLTPITFQLCV